MESALKENVSVKTFIQDLIVINLLDVIIIAMNTAIALMVNAYVKMDGLVMIAKNNNVRIIVIIMVLVITGNAIAMMDGKDLIVELKNAQLNAQMAVNALMAHVIVHQGLKENIANMNLVLMIVVDMELVKIILALAMMITLV
jgi:hypothetical protein